MPCDDAWCVIVLLATFLEYERLNTRYSLFLYSSQIKKRFPEWTGLVGFSSTLQGHADCRGNWCTASGTSDRLLFYRHTNWKYQHFQ